MSSARGIEVVRLEREHAEIAQDLDEPRVNLERHVELRERDVLVPHGRERATEAVVIERDSSFVRLLPNEAMTRSRTDAASRSRLAAV